MQKSFDEALPDDSKLKRIAKEAMQDCQLRQTSSGHQDFESHMEKLSAQFQQQGQSLAIPNKNYILSDALDHFLAGRIS